MTQKFLRDDGSFQPIASAGSSATGPATLLTKSTTAAITVNTTSWTDGPAVAQGTAGTWLVTGTLSFSSTASFFIYAQLWDGTTTIASADLQSPSRASVGLSGAITNPAGNLRLSARVDAGGIATMQSTLSQISAPGADSTITAIRIG